MISMLLDLPSGLKCAWYNLPHPAQYAILIMVSARLDFPRCCCGESNSKMLGCLYGLNRVFDKLDKVMVARLSCATGNYMQQRRQALRM
ncbi:unnamed protein product [Ectocarpus sp. CCAP 1310/34]|nr:unnamed protein product [Ectocarpus sp. CCAP 1310/34]